MTKENTKREDGFLTIGKGDLYDIHFARYELEENLEPLRKFLRMKRYKVGDSSVDYRVLSSWDDAGLLPKGVNEKGWRRFTLPEVIWLEAIKRMRNYGVTFSEIAQIKDSVMEWNDKAKRYAEFEYYVSKALLSSDDPYIVVLKNGADIGTSHEIEKAKIILGSQDALLVSLKSILSDLGFSVVKPAILYSLTNDEKKALTEIRAGNDRTVKLKTKNRKITNVDVSQIVDPEAWQALEKQLREKGIYASVETQTEDGKVVSKKVTYKKKF